MNGFFSVKQVAKRFGKSEETVKRWLRKGERFPNAVKQSDKQGWIIPLTDIENDSSVTQVKTSTNISEPDNIERELIKLAFQVGTMTQPSEELIGILSFVGIKRTLELMLVLRQSPSLVRNQTAFLKKAIREGWTPDTVPQKIERKKSIHQSTRTEILPEWIDKIEKTNTPLLNKELTTDQLIKKYNITKKLSELGNQSATNELNSLLVELENRGLTI